MVSTCTTYSNKNKLFILPHSVFVFCMILTVKLLNINKRVVFIIGTACVLCRLGTEFLYTI
jgi:hypothetical protein